MTAITRTYINKYLKRNAILILCLALPISVLFLVVSLFYNVLAYDIWLSFFPLGIGLLCFLLSTLYVIRFLSLIKQQERLLDVSFSDEGSVQISGSLIFLSDDWLICAGTCAFHRKFIKSFSLKRYVSGAGVGYKVIVKAVNKKKYGFWIMSYSDINTLRKWKKESH